MSFFASDDSEDEQWLQNHKKHFQNPKEFQNPEGPDWKERPKKRRARRRQPREPETMKQMCPHCKQEAPPETFRDTKCLACQITDYLGPTP